MLPENETQPTTRREKDFNRQLGRNVGRLAMPRQFVRYSAQRDDRGRRTSDAVEDGHHLRYACHRHKPGGRYCDRGTQSHPASDYPVGVGYW